MRSIAGFNGSSINGSFAAGESISASALNKLATGIDVTRTMPSNDIIYQANTNGTSYSLPQQVYYGQQAGPWTPRDNGDGTFSVVAGTVNGLIPCIGNPGVVNLLTFKGTPTPSEDYVFNDAGDCYIYLQCAIGDGDPPQWPEVDPTKDNYPTIYAFDAPQTDDDTYGMILLALAQKDPASTDPFPTVTFTQFIFNSLWSERHKYSQPDSALYYFYRV